MIESCLIRFRVIELSVFFFLLVPGLLVHAQDLCPVKTVVVNSVQGRVFGGGSEVTPIVGTLVELRTISAENRLVESTRTDKEGRFRFQNQDDGNYRVIVHLEIEGRDVMPSFDFIARIKKGKAPGRELRIVLEMDCAYTVIQRVKKPKT